MEKNHRNVCDFSGTELNRDSRVTYADGREGRIAEDPAKIGRYSYQFVCPRCGKSTDARFSVRKGAFVVTSHISKKEYAERFHQIQEFRQMGTRVKKSVSA
jgi:hypothetical protein